MGENVELARLYATANERPGKYPALEQCFWDESREILVLFAQEYSLEQLEHLDRIALRNPDIILEIAKALLERVAKQQKPG